MILGIRRLGEENARYTPFYLRALVKLSYYKESIDEITCPKNWNFLMKYIKLANKQF